MLDHSYNVVSRYDLYAEVFSICRVDPRLVAVAVGDKEMEDDISDHPERYSLPVRFPRHDQHDMTVFIKESNGQLILDRFKTLYDHKCRGIAHRHGNLYIASGIALYQYTMDGRHLWKLYEDRSPRSGNVQPLKYL